MPVARVICALAVVVLCGSATAIAGPIAFVGLTVPHVARLFTGPDHRWLLPYSALMARLLLLVSDVVGRVIARPAEVQVGVVTAVIGALAFIVLVRRRKLVKVDRGAARGAPGRASRPPPRRDARAARVTRAVPRARSGVRTVARGRRLHRATGGSPGHPLRCQHR
ncbi:MAG TPA: iron chelate uptake ABC transporter family permease subunit [Amycolatopsis sp.]|nr:iron chelate uptake ABC transporter family permease subunit [Amycolatopsis sp.]